MTGTRSGLRFALLLAAAVLMGLTALVNAAIVVPHLLGDLAEIQVRASLVQAVSHALSFGTLAMFAFTLVVLVSAIQSLRGGPVSLPALAITAVSYGGFGIVLFLASRSPHALGYAAIGALIAIAAFATPTSGESSRARDRGTGGTVL